MPRAMAATTGLMRPAGSAFRQDDGAGRPQPGHDRGDHHGRSMTVLELPQRHSGGGGRQTDAAKRQRRSAEELFM